MFGNILRNSKPSSTAETLEGKKLRVVIVEVKKPLIKTVITRLAMGRVQKMNNITQQIRSKCLNPGPSCSKAD